MTCATDLCQINLLVLPESHKVRYYMFNMVFFLTLLSLRLLLNDWAHAGALEAPIPL